jgi:hypothetical protein
MDSAIPHGFGSITIVKVMCYLEYMEKRFPRLKLSILFKRVCLCYSFIEDVSKRKQVSAVQAISEIGQLLFIIL